MLNVGLLSKCRQEQGDKGVTDFCHCRNNLFFICRVFMAAVAQQSANFPSKLHSRYSFMFSNNDLSHVTQPEKLSQTLKLWTVAKKML